LRCSADGAGTGLSAQGGATGPGLRAQGGATSGDGLVATGVGTGHGIAAVGGSTSGDGIRATVTSGIELNALPSFTVQADAGNSVTQVKTDRAETNNDNWIGSLAVVRTGVLKGQVVKVSDYDGTTKIMTFAGTGTTAVLANGVVVSIINQ
jgi:hypothetical protein